MTFLEIVTPIWIGGTVATTLIAFEDACERNEHFRNSSFGKKLFGVVLILPVMFFIWLPAILGFCIQKWEELRRKRG